MNEPQIRDPLVTRTEAAMRELSSLAGEIGWEHGSHPAMYAVNRAWHSLGIARDELEKTIAANTLSNPGMVQPAASPASCSAGASGV